MRGVVTTKQYDRSFRRCKKRGLDMQKLKPVILALASGDPLAAKYRDHLLKGDYAGCRECHIQPDWLLVYRVHGSIIELVDMGSHADLFG